MTQRNCRGALLGILVSVATLFHHVLVVISISAKKEMIRIATGRVIALVKHMQSIGYWAVVEFVRKTMNIQNFSVNHKGSVACLDAGSLPFPAAFRRALVDRFPENHRWIAAMMVLQIRKRFALHPSIIYGITRCKSCLLAATALAQAFGVVQAEPLFPRNKSMLAAIMAFYVGDRLAFDPSLFGSVVTGYLGSFATTTVAITVGNILRGIMGLHKNLLILVPSLGRLQRRQALSIGFYSFILAQVSEYGNA